MVKQLIGVFFLAGSFFSVNVFATDYPAKEPEHRNPAVQCKAASHCKKYCKSSQKPVCVNYKCACKNL